MAHAFLVGPGEPDQDGSRHDVRAVCAHSVPADQLVPGLDGPPCPNCLVKVGETITGDEAARWAL